VRALAGVALAAMVGVGASGCAPKASPRQIEAARQTRAQQLVESGNEAYKLGDYRLAARRYAAAAVVKKDDPAAYFGMGMALSKLGRDEEARAAYARSRELARTRSVLDWPGTHGAAGAPPETIPTPHTP
jgi:Flp pilus assembly protein TadD